MNAGELEEMARKLLDEPDWSAMTKEDILAELGAMADVACKLTEAPASQATQILTNLLLRDTIKILAEIQNRP